LIIYGVNDDAFSRLSAIARDGDDGACYDAYGGGFEWPDLVKFD